MSFSCADFADAIIEALGVTIPTESADNPSDQARICIDAITDLKTRAGITAVTQVELLMLEGFSKILHHLTVDDLGDDEVEFWQRQRDRVENGGVFREKGE